MTARKQKLTSVPCLVAGVVLLAVPARADDFVCDGTFMDEVFDNVIVPSDATCILEGVTVEGNVSVEGELRLTGSTVGGNVQGDGFVWVVIEPNDEVPSVAGNVQLKNGSGFVVIGNSEVVGDVQLENNEVDAEINVFNNLIGGDLQVTKNTADDITIGDNEIGGNLQCKANDPAPDGGGNDVGGNAEDQCEDLTSASAAPGDCDYDGDVDTVDLLMLFGSWGPCSGCPADFNGDGTVGIPDLFVLFANWSP